MRLEMMILTTKKKTRNITLEERKPGDIFF